MVSATAAHRFSQARLPTIAQIVQDSCHHDGQVPVLNVSLKVCVHLKVLLAPLVRPTA